MGRQIDVFISGLAGVSRQDKDRRVHVAGVVYEQAQTQDGSM